MEIITEDGKDYIETYVAKIDNNRINAGALFLDVKETVEDIIKKKNRKNKTRDVAIYNGYGKNLQTFLNRYSGDYFSPSFMKNYETNPALSLMETFFTEGANDATAIGTDFHSIMEDYYNLPKEERDRKILWELKKNHIREGQDIEVLDEYIEGYINIKDYLHPRSELNDKELECVTEHRGRISNLYVKNVGYTIPCAVSYVADRIDYRGDDVIILDYKTGHPKSTATSFNGYLGSMLLYKWAMEQELNTTITKGYLICPGNTPSQKYMELDYSKENEEKMVEMVDNFYKKFIKDNRNREYEYTDNGYFTTDDAKAYREIMNDNTIWNSKIPVKLYIGEHDEAY